MINIQKASEVEDGQGLGEELIVGRCDSLSKDRKLTPQILTLIKKRKITHIPIKNQSKKNLKEEYTQNFLQSLEQVALNLNYLDILSNLNIEKRYGLASQNEESLSVVFDIYNQYLKNPVVNQLLSQLKNNDLYTFLHSIDVFTLGTLFARHLQLPLLEVISLGYLFHDIGKSKIPHKVLNKPSKLTRIEYDVIKNHTFEGENILKNVGFEHISYFAGLHHERHDGSGYPNGLRGNEIPIEIEILHIIDTFSAITLERSYKLDKHSTDAMTILCQEKHLFNKELLYKFINFIGIYPKGAVVLLSNSYHAVIEQTNPNFPLLPNVKCIETGTSFMMPTDFTLRVKELMSFKADTSAEVFNKFLQVLINGDCERLTTYYDNYKERYQPHELFLKVVIPIYQTLSILKHQSIIPNVCYNRAIQNLCFLLQSTNHELKSINQMHKTYLIVLPKELMMDLNIQIFEGLLHTDGIYPLFIQQISNNHSLQSVIETCQIDSIVFIDKKLLAIDQLKTNYNKYYISIKELANLTSRFLGTSPHQFSMTKYLKRYMYT